VALTTPAVAEAPRAVGVDRAVVDTIWNF